MHEDDAGASVGAPVSIGPIALGLVLTFTMTMATFSQFVVGTLAPVLTADLGLSRTQIGGLTTAAFGVAAITSTHAGVLVDRIRDRQAMALLYGTVAVMYLGMSAARSYVWLVVAIALGGFAQALANPVTNTMIACHVPERSRGAIVGVKQSGVQFGALLAGLLLPGAAVMFGWRTALLGVVCLAMAGLLTTAMVVPAGPRATRLVSAQGTKRGRLGGQVWALTVYAFAMGGGVASTTVHLPLYAHERLGFDAAVAGTTIAAAGMVAILSRIVWGRLSDRLDRLWSLLGGLALGALLGTVAILLAPVWPPAVWFGVALLGTSAMAWNSVAMIAALRAAPAGSAGRVSGVVNVGFFGGFVVSPIVFGAIVDVTASYVAAWGMLLGAYVVALSVSAILNRRGTVLTTRSTR